MRYGCRRKVDSKMVNKSFCNKSNLKPRADVRDCNQKPCPPPMYAAHPIKELKTTRGHSRVSPVLFCSFPLQLGDGGVAELQQALRQDGDAGALGQLRPAAGRQQHASHPQQALQRQPARDTAVLQPTPLPHPVEGGLLVPGRWAGAGPRPGWGRLRVGGSSVSSHHATVTQDASGSISQSERAKTLRPQHHEVKVGIN